MGFWKRLFGLEEEVIIETEQETEPIDIKSEPEEVATGNECDYCKEEIYEGEPIRTIVGKKFHKRCAKRAIKQAKQELGV